MVRVLIVLLLLTSGCAFIPDTVDLRYHSMTASSPIPGAGLVRVNVVVNDSRVGRPDQISVKKNGYGMELAPILATRPVAEVVRDALLEELRKDGFDTGAGDVAAIVEVSKFTNDFKIGFFSGDASSEVILSVQVRGVDGRIAYTRAIVADNLTGGIYIAGGDNAKESLERALSNAIGKLLLDPAFTRALLDSAARRRPSV